MTDSEVKSLAETAADDALRKFMLMLGVDVSAPPAILELQKDFSHLREVRMAGGKVRDKILSTATGSVVTFVIGAAGYYVMHGPK